MDDATVYFETLKNNIAKYNPNSNTEFIKKAGEFAVKAHDGQNRKSGEPFIMHPFNVAIILSELEMDDEAIVAGLLHDTVEDTSCTISEIKENFGENVALLVEGVTKLGKIPYSTKQEQQVENLRKMFLAMAKDIRVVIIKLADRLHNMRTLKSMSEEKQLSKAHETMEFFAPLANRLGMQRVKWELEDLSLRYLDPIAYKEISDHINLKRGERLEYLENVKATLQSKLDEMGIEAGMSGRAKHFYSIYKKMYTNNISIDEIYDLLAVRVIVNSINECYTVLGMVHEIYKPIPGRFKDYIAMPKKNMYQSLHTSLIGPGGRPFEVQIRTWEMHKIAEVGIAAHWKYKEGVSGATDLDNKLEWVRQLLEIHRDNDAEDFIHTLKIDLFEDEVFVFSPKGAVINLPNGAGPIDFAYAIHSAIGNKTVGAKVNGKIVTLEHKLKNGDIVEIITSSNSRGPSRDWLKIVKTSQAKKKINDWFKKENREENIIKGREMLERELKKVGIPSSALNDKQVMEPVYKKFTLSTLDDLLSTIGFGGVPLSKAFSRVKDQYRKIYMVKNDTNAIEDLVNISSEKISKSNNGIIVKGINNCLLKISRCCNPVPGDDIVGYITKGRGVSVHRTDCINVTNLNDIDAQRFIEVWWSEDQNSSYTTDLQIIANDRSGLMIDVMNAVSAVKSSIKAVNSRVTKDNLAIINITAVVSSQEQIQKIIKSLKMIESVTSVTRLKH